MYHTAFMYWMCGKLSFKSGMAFSFTKITPFGNAINDREERWQKEVLLPALILWTMVTLEMISLQEGGLYSCMVFLTLRDFQFITKPVAFD